MKNSEKKEQEQIRELLRQNIPPNVEMEQRRTLHQLNQDIGKMDYSNPQSFAEKILIQISYFSPWIWLIQTGLLAMSFYYSCLERGDRMAIFMLFLAPCLTLILLWELSRILGHNMWEMEAACRYNLPRLFFFRLCILSGADFLVLGSVLVLFCATGGLLWQFALNVLLPFFLMSSLCLWALRRFGSRVNIFALATINMVLFSLWTSGLLNMPLLIYGSDFHLTNKNNLDSLPGIVLWVTLFALVLFFINAYRLCSKQYYEINRKDHSIWNLE